MKRGELKRDLRGEVFGQLTVVQFAGRSQHRQGRWRVLCSCGAVFVTLSASLLAGRTVSCGCKRVGVSVNRVHGHAQGGKPSREWSSWYSMLKRCRDPKARNYHNYGGRGITVCERWVGDFVTFFADMGHRPKGMTLDRIDTNGNYEPSNCRWATSQTQSWNRRDIRRLTWRGETKPAPQWALEIGLPRQTLAQRLRDGWSVERALATPLHRRAL